MPLGARRRHRGDANGRELLHGGDMRTTIEAVLVDHVDQSTASAPFRRLELRIAADPARRVGEGGPEPPRPRVSEEMLDTYGHLWPDSDDRTRQAVDGVLSRSPEACTRPRGNTSRYKPAEGG